LVLLVIDSIKISGSILTIQNCFRKAGLYPFNVDEPLNNIRCIQSEKSFYQIDPTQKVSGRLNINGKCITNNDVIEEISKKRKMLYLIQI